MRAGARRRVRDKIFHAFDGFASGRPKPVPPAMEFTELSAQGGPTNRIPFSQWAGKAVIRFEQLICSGRRSCGRILG
jgi:hypothetical protein